MTSKSKRTFLGALCATLAIALAIIAWFCPPTGAVVGAEAVDTVALGTKLRVYLIGGQSNATGLSEQGHLNNEDKEQVFNDVLIYIDGYDGWGGSVDANFRKKVVPVTLGDHNSMGMMNHLFGQEVGMAQILSEAHPNETVAIIKCAFPGTDLAEQWASPSYRKEGAIVAQGFKSGELYDIFVRVVGEGLAAYRALGYTPEIQGMVWMQGENDATYDHMAPYYERNLGLFIDDLRKESVIPDDMPFVIGTIAENSRVKGFLDTVIEAQKKVGSTHSNCAYVDGRDAVLKASDPWHYDAYDMIDYGRRFASTLLNITEPKEVKSVQSRSMTFAEGYTPVLVPYVTATMDDDTHREWRVDWNEPSEYKEGNYTVEGTLVGTSVKTSYSITVTTREYITIDGDLDEYVWKNAPSFTLPDGSEAKIVYTDNGLYFGFDVKDNDIAFNEGTVTVFDCDTTVIYLDTAFNGGDNPQSDDYGFIVGYHNIAHMYQGNGGGWEQKSVERGFSPYKFATKTNGTPLYNKDTDVGFTTEFFVPWDLIGGKKTGTMGIYVGRIDYKTSGGGGWSSVSGTDSNTPKTYMMLNANGINKSSNGRAASEIGLDKDNAFLPDRIPYINSDGTVCDVPVIWNNPDAQITDGSVVSGKLPYLANKSVNVTVKLYDVASVKNAIAALDVNSLTAADKEKIEELEQKLAQLPDNLKEWMDESKLALAKQKVNAAEQENPAPKDKGGCGSALSAAVGLVGLIILLAAACVLALIQRRHYAK